MTTELAVGQSVEKIQRLMDEVGKRVLGQTEVLEQVLIAILAGGHALLEGVPGLGKTLLVKTLADCMAMDFRRIQFTPDLLPADIVGTMIYNQKEGSFEPKLGPVFANLVLADEINRAPAKVQSALLESMQEKQVTIGDQTYALPKPFLVLATQNPIEQEGTYRLPEAQVDRFMLKLNVGYPTKAEERNIMDRMTASETPSAQVVAGAEDIFAARGVVRDIYVDERIREYIVNLIFATREPAEHGVGQLADYIEFGASPRASIAMLTCARAHAFLRGRGYVIPEDIKAIGFDVLRHRISLTFEAEAENVDAEQVIRGLFDHIEVP